MNNDFDEDLERTGAHKSRKKPSMRTVDYHVHKEDLNHSPAAEGAGKVVAVDGSGDRQPELFPIDRSKRRSDPGRGRPDSGSSRSRGHSASSVSRRQTAATSGRSSSASRSAAKTAGQKKRKRIIITAVAECLVLALIFSYAFVARRLSLVQKLDFAPKEVANQDLTPVQKQHMQGYWTIAVFGVDSRGKNVGKGTNADVNMICSINMDTGEIKLVSVYRDSYLNINDSNAYNKINMAYAQGGPQQAVKAMNKNLDLDIQDYITFNWKAVADSINILGGVDVDISKTEFSYINSFITETVKATGVGSHHLKKAGSNHLDGVQAVAYGRLRLMDTDFARTERQRLIISKAFDKAKKSDFSVLNNILVTVLPQVATNLNLEDLTNIALTIGKYHIGETTGFPAARGDLRMGKKGLCVIPQTLESNVIELHKFLYNKENYTPTDKVKKISTKIAADSGMYKEGKAVDHVKTDGGYDPKPEESDKETDARKDETLEDEFEYPSETETREGETTTEGDINDDWPDEWETDSNGGGSGPSKETTAANGSKPETETKPSPTKPSGENTKPTKPDSTISSDEITGPGVKPTAPSETTKAHQSGETETSGVNKQESTAAVPTVAPPPIDTGGNSSSGPGGSGEPTSSVSPGPGN